MTILFDNISSARRVPGSQVEFSAVRAIGNLPPAPNRILVIGQRLTGGTVAALTPTRMISASQANGAFGRGSILAAMVAAALAANTVNEVTAVALDDNAGGTAATYTITLTGPTSAGGQLNYLIAGQKVQVGVASGDTATAMATALAAAINALPDLPVTASSASGVVTLTFRHKGTAGNDLQIRANHYDGQQLPAGVTSASAAAVVGATDPDLTAAWACIAGAQYSHIALGLNTGTALSAADTELNARWGPGQQIEGRAYVAIEGSVSTCAALGATRNGIFTTVIGGRNFPRPTWVRAAAAAGVAALNLGKDPARPLTDLVVPGEIAPRIPDRFSDIERDQLLGTGISTLRFNTNGEVVIERLISSNLTDEYGYPTVAFRNVQTSATLSYFRFSWRRMIQLKYPRAKRTEDTLAAMKADTIAIAREWDEAELIEDIEGFIAGLILEFDATNRDQVNVLMTPNTVNGVLQVAARVEFIL